MPFFLVIVIVIVNYPTLSNTHPWRAREREPIMGVWGGAPSGGPGGRAPGGGQGGEAPCSRRGFCV